MIITDSHDHWGTPKDFYDKLNQEFKFDFDPCPINHDLKLWDGLKIEWGKSNYINPPYNRKDKPKFIKKAYEESLKGKICVMLIPCATSTKEFHKYILPFAEIRFLKGRLKFLENGILTKKKGSRDLMIVIFKSKN